MKNSMCELLMQKSHVYTQCRRSRVGEIERDEHRFQFVRVSLNLQKLINEMQECAGNSVELRKKTE